METRDESRGRFSATGSCLQISPLNDYVYTYIYIYSFTISTALWMSMDFGGSTDENLSVTRCWTSEGPAQASS